MRHNLLRVLFAVLAILLAPLASANAERRVALVIGNSAYTANPLQNPERDAAAVAAKLEAMGFESVALEKNLTYDGMRNALRRFGRKATGADTAIIYYAGHGTEVYGRNFLIPIDAQLERVGDLTFEAIDLGSVAEQLTNVSHLRLVILDACRNNIFPLMGSQRGAKRGLARVEPDSNTIVAFAAREGTTADDGYGGNSPFTTALLHHLATPGLDVRLLLGRVRDDVVKSTGGAQQPAIYGSLGGEEVALVPRALSPDSDAEGPAGQSEAARGWADIKESTSPAVLEAFITQFPGTVYAALARERLTKLNTAASTDPASIVGTWTGNIVDKASGTQLPYTMELTFKSPTAGHADYPSFPCAGDLTRIGAEPASTSGPLAFKEKISSGRNKCMDGDVIVKLEGDRLSWSWFEEGSDAPRATAELVRAASSGPAYAGLWASEPNQCAVPQEEQNAPLLMTANRFDQHEAHCEFKRTANNANEWKVWATCLVEGNAQDQQFGFVVDGDTLTIKEDHGERVLKRCK